LENIIDNNGDDYFNQGIYLCKYSEPLDRLYNGNGLLYEKGAWNKPLDENKEIKETISRLEKEIEELKLKVK
jgi:hypothetical protein